MNMRREFLQQMAIASGALALSSLSSASTAVAAGTRRAQNAASFLVVELMRQGRSPMDAFREAIARVVHKRPEASKFLQACFLAINRNGDVGAHALHQGFVYAVCDDHRQDALLESSAVYATGETGR